jgi:hypothetical protein
MRGKRNSRLAPPSQNIITAWLDGNQLGVTAMFHRQLREMSEECIAHLFFVLRDGFYVHQRAREFENVHSIPINS